MKRKIVHEFKCEQPLSAFSKAEGGKYCGACKTVVIDLTAKSNEEIIEIISANNGNVCGSILSGQFEETHESSFGLRGKVAATGLAVLLGLGVDSVRAQNTDKTKTEIVASPRQDSIFSQNVNGQTNIQPSIETPDKKDKKPKQRKRKVFMRIGSLSFYTSNMFPFVGARRMVYGRLKY